MSPDDLDNLLLLAKQHAYLPIAVIVVGYLTKLTDPRSKLVRINIPARYQPLVVLALGQLYACLAAMQNGTPWRQAVLHGLVVAFVSMGAYDVLKQAIFNGNPPAWIQKLVFIPKPETSPLNGADPERTLDPEEVKKPSDEPAKSDPK